MPKSNLSVRIPSWKQALQTHYIRCVSANPSVFPFDSDDTLDLSLRITDSIVQCSQVSAILVASMIRTLVTYVLSKTSKGTPGLTSDTFIHSVP